MSEQKWTDDGDGGLTGCVLIPASVAAEWPTSRAEPAAPQPASDSPGDVRAGTA